MNVGADDTATSYGVFVRVMWLTDRESEYGRKD